MTHMSYAKNYPWGHRITAERRSKPFLACSKAKNKRRKSHRTREDQSLRVPQVQKQGRGPGATSQPGQKGSPYFLPPNSLAKGKTGVEMNMSM